MKSITEQLITGLTVGSFAGALLAEAVAAPDQHGNSHQPHPVGSRSVYVVSSTAVSTYALGQYVLVANNGELMRGAASDEAASDLDWLANLRVPQHPAARG